MTEKRFTIKPSMIVDDVTVIIDNQKEYTFPVLDSTLNYMFCKVLNEQHETIQRLKQNIDELLSVDIEEELLKENEQLKHRLAISEKAKYVTTLEKENEQLKEKNGQLLAKLKYTCEQINYSEKLREMMK